MGDDELKISKINRNISENSKAKEVKRNAEEINIYNDEEGKKENFVQNEYSKNTPPEEISTLAEKVAIKDIDNIAGISLAKEVTKTEKSQKFNNLKSPTSKKLAEYGVDLNKPFVITDEMISKMKSKGKKGFWESIKDGAKNAIPFISGTREIYKSIELLAIVKKQEKGEQLSDEEKITLYEYLLNQTENEYRGSSFWGKVGDGLSHMPAFAGEFALTGGLYSLGKTATTKVATKLVGEVTKKQLAKYLTKKAVGVAGGAAVRTVALSNTYSSIISRRIQTDTSKLNDDGTGEITLKENNESWAKSVGNGALDGYIESLSEQSGAGFNYVLSKPLGKLPLGKLFVPSAKTQKFMSKTGFNGIIEEYCEERLGGTLRAITGLSDKNKTLSENLYDAIIPGWEQTGVELATTMCWGGTMHTAHSQAIKLLDNKEELSKVIKEKISSAINTGNEIAYKATPLLYLYGDKLAGIPPVILNLIASKTELAVLGASIQNETKEEEKPTYDNKSAELAEYKHMVTQKYISFLRSRAISTPVEQQVTINGEAKTITVYRYKNNKNQVALEATDGEKIYSIQLIANTKFIDEVKAGKELYELAGIKTPNIDSIEIDNSPALVYERNILYTSNPSAVASGFGINMLLNNIQGNVHYEKGDKTQTAHITNPSMHIFFNTDGKEYKIHVRSDFSTLFNGFGKLKIKKEDIMESLKKAVNISNEKIVEIVKKHNLNNSEAVIYKLIERKNFIKTFLNNLEKSEQKGTPLQEYLKIVWDYSIVEQNYKNDKKAGKTKLIDVISEKFGINIRQLLDDDTFSPIDRYPELQEYLAEKIKKDELSFNEINYLSIALKTGNAINKIPPTELKELSDVFLEIYRKTNIPSSTVFKYLYEISRSNFLKQEHLSPKILSSMLEVRENFTDAEKDSLFLYRTMIKENGEINKNLVDVYKYLTEKDLTPDNKAIILKSLVSLNNEEIKVKFNKIKELAERGIDAKDIAITYAAINSADNFDESMLEYIEKFKQKKITPDTATTILINTGNCSIETKRAIVSFIVDNFNGNQEDAILLANSLSYYSKDMPDIVNDIIKAKGNNNNLTMRDICEISKELYMAKANGTPYYDYVFSLLNSGITTKHLDSMLSSLRFTLGIDKMPEAKEKLYKMVKTLLTEKKASPLTVKEVLRRVPTVYNHSFNLNFIINNMDKLTPSEIITIIDTSNIENKSLSMNELETRRNIITKFMIKLLDKGTELGVAKNIVSNCLDYEFSSQYVQPHAKDINISKLNFINKCLEMNIDIKTINTIANNFTILRNGNKLTKEEIESKSKDVLAWADKLITEQKFKPEDVGILLVTVNEKGINLARNAIVTYDFNMKYVEILSDWIKRGILTPDSEINMNIKTLLDGIKVENYNTEAIKIAEHLIKNEVTLDNGEKYKVDINTLGWFIMMSTNIETNEFDKNIFYKHLQLYPLIAKYNFSGYDINQIFEFTLGNLKVTNLKAKDKTAWVNKMAYLANEERTLFEQKLLNGNKKVSDEYLTIEKFISKILTVKEVSGKGIHSNIEQRRKLLYSIISNTNINNETGLTSAEHKIIDTDFTKYAKNGLPLKYSRKSLIENINSIINNLSAEEKQKLLEFHNVDLIGFNTIPKIKATNYTVSKPSTKQFTQIISDMEKIFNGLTTDSQGIYKKTSTKSVKEMCIQIANLNEEEILAISQVNPEFSTERINAAKAKAQEWGNILLENSLDNLPLPIAIQIIDKEINIQRTFTPEMQIASEKIEEECRKYIYENEILTGDKELDEILNNIIQGLPDMMLMIGKPQHKTHHYSVDIHTLEVLKKALKSNEYQLLSAHDRTILKFSILLHDFGKKFTDINTPDAGHEVASAEIAEEILSNYTLPQRTKERILNLVKNHNWFSRFSHNDLDTRQVTTMFRVPADYTIAKIMAKSDFSSINPSFHYDTLNIPPEKRTPEYFSEHIDMMLANVEKEYKKMYGKTNILMNSIIHNSDKIPFDKQYEVRVLNLTDKNISDNEDLGKYGLSGSTLENLRLTVHMVESKNLYENLESARLGMENLIGDKNVWSLSLLKKGQIRTYHNREYGLLVDVPLSNIAVASPYNIASGYEKNSDKFTELIFASAIWRNHLINTFSQSMNKSGYPITQEDYEAISKLIYNKTALSQLEANAEFTINTKRFPTQVIIKAIQESTDSLFSNKKHIEMVAVNPALQGIVAKKSSLSEVSKDLLIFAQKYNLPIILVGNN